MSLFKRGETWWVRFTAPDGQRIRQSTGTTDRAQAAEYHDKLKAQLWRTVKLGEKPTRTWNEAAVLWLKETAHKATHEQDRAILRWLDPHLGGKLLSAITRELVAEIGEAKAK